MKTYFIKYTKVDKDDSKWNRNASFIYKTNEFLTDLSVLEKDLLAELKGTDFHEVVLETVTFLNDIPDVQEKKYMGPGAG